MIGSGIDGFDAFLLAWEDLNVHFGIVVLVALSITLFSFVRSIIAFFREPIDSLSEWRVINETWNSLIYCGSFALFGIFAAYFFILGLKSDDYTERNALLSDFATPVIALLTAGVAFAASRSKIQVAASPLLLGMGSFLLACLLSYQTFTMQIHKKPIEPVVESIAPDMERMSAESLGEFQLPDEGEADVD